MIAIFMLFLPGCSLQRPVQEQWVDSITLHGQKSIGQTFVAEFDGLMGIVFTQVSQNGPHPETMLLSLWDSPIPEHRTLLAQEVITWDTAHSDGPVRYPFKSQPDSNQKYYYVSLQILDAGELDFSTAPGRAYINGAHYINDHPTNGQLTFQLVYNPWLVAWTLLKEVAHWILVLFAGGFLFTVPGAALIRALWPDWSEFDWLDLIALGTGAGLAIYPIVFLWTDVIGVHLGAAYAWGIPLLGLGYLIGSQRKNPIAFESLRFADTRPFLISVLVLLTGLVATRFWVIRGLEAGMWGDSVQHTMMAQLFVDNGGLFHSWEPYTRLSTFTYHFGFHASVASFHWITRIPIVKSVLWIGQFWNIFAVLLLYPVTKKISKSAWGGLAAILVAGFLSSMPMYYTNWGRYTQLAGQVVLPVLMFFVLQYSEKLNQAPKLKYLIVLLFAGLFLTHYRIFVWGGLFLFLYLLIALLTKKTKVLVGGYGLILFLAFLVVVPWINNLMGGKIVDTLVTYLSLSTKVQTGSVRELVDDYNYFPFLSSWTPAWFWFLGVVGLILSIIAKPGVKHSRLFALWGGSLFLASNPQWLGLPGAGIMTNFLLMIGAYVFIAPLFGSGFAIMNQIKGISANKDFILATCLCVGVIFGANQQIADNYPPQAAQVYFSTPDRIAFAWLEENVPIDSLYLVEGLFAYNNTSIVGEDAGWWLSLLTAGEGIIPPLTYASEAGLQDDDSHNVEAIHELLAESEKMDDQVKQALVERGVDYLYIGQRRTIVGGRTALLDQALLAEVAWLELVYEQDFIRVYRLSE